MLRQDYAFPFAIDPASRMGALASSYEAHVEQMIRQVLLTSPGERVDLPDFGCGVRRLLFAPNSQPLEATVQLTVQQALTKWLAQHITVSRVVVLPPGAATESGQPVSPEGNELFIRIEYVLRQTLASKGLEVLVQ
jgi:phage baseplate assembly protein W